MPTSDGPTATTLAEAIRTGDRVAIERITKRPIKPESDNFVDRPWGGRSLARYKGKGASAARRWGEAFELAADDRDAEARTHPSIVRLEDGSTLELPTLLAVAPAELLGERCLEQHGPRLPLLPKTLDIAELLSVQAHPAGFTEAYLILEAEPGATIRLGFCQDVEPAALRRQLLEGRRWQEQLLTLLVEGIDQQALQRALTLSFSQRQQGVAEVVEDLTPRLRSTGLRPQLEQLLMQLKRRFWQVLDLLNEIPVWPGQVLHNATPARIDRLGAPSAEVHALGNSEGREILALEIRRPAVTFRAWDHVRFPLREIDIDRALEALNLRATRPEEFFVEPAALAGRPGVYRSVEDQSYIIDHLRPSQGQAVDLPEQGQASTLHAICGAAGLYDGAGRRLDGLRRGESMLLPAVLGRCQLIGESEQTEVIQVSLPRARPAVHEIAAPTFLRRPPRALRFGTSGLRGLVSEMTDLEVYINTRGFLTYLARGGDAAGGDPVAVAEDLRAVDPISGLSSSPRIALAVAQAVRDAGHEVVHCGRVPTPALANFGLRGSPKHGPMPSVMVTGSHIPADRNGVKFYKRQGEVLKRDEAGILDAVAEIRAAEYARSSEASAFDAEGMFKRPPAAQPETAEAANAYCRRYLDLFAGQRPLSGKRLVFFQHSAVGRDLFVELFRALGAEVTAVERSECFVPVDTEDVSAEDRRHFAALARQHRPDAVLSTDGDSDRPLVIDEMGRFHRGDVLGIVCAEFLGATFAAVPVSATDALERHLVRRGSTMRVARTRIGSPYVIAEMQRAVAEGEQRVVGWEANGGFLTATETTINGRPLAPLPTRDAFLPMLAALLSAADRGVELSRVFDELPQRATGAGLLDDFPREVSEAMLLRFRPADAQVVDAVFAGEQLTVGRVGEEPPQMPSADEGLMRDLRIRRRALTRYFGTEHGFGPITRINYLDGVRVWFESGEIVHLRPSGNAPQLRIYAVSDDQRRTAQIVESATAGDDGILWQIAREIAGAGGR